ncbi:MAG: HigA family addiction module antitoxin [Casimicrobiaceae bacterium]
MATKQLGPIPPGEILREEFMRPLGVSINTLARDLDVPSNRISEIVNGKRAITGDTAFALASISTSRRRSGSICSPSYELRVARRDVWPRAEPRVRSRAAA